MGSARRSTSTSPTTSESFELKRSGLGSRSSVERHPPPEEEPGPAHRLAPDVVALDERAAAELPEADRLPEHASADERRRAAVDELGVRVLGRDEGGSRAGLGHEPEILKAAAEREQREALEMEGEAAGRGALVAEQRH